MPCSRYLEDLAANELSTTRTLRLCGGAEPPIEAKADVAYLLKRRAMSILQLTPHLENLRVKQKIFQTGNALNTLSIAEYASCLTDIQAMLFSSTIHSDLVFKGGFMETPQAGNLELLDWKAKADFAVFRHDSFMIDEQTCQNKPSF